MSFSCGPTLPCDEHDQVSLPETLKAFVDHQAAERGYRTGSEYVCDLIHKDKDRQSLRSQLLDGRNSPATPAVDETYFADLRALAVQTCPNQR